MSLYKIVRSKFYKNFMAKLYGIGASIVITGALFKIVHWNFADQMLMIGMFTEAIIFLFSAFEPLHKEYDWALVYPELGRADEFQGNGQQQPTTITQQLDKMLEEAKIGPELIESLSAGMKNLSENAKKLSFTADAAMATEGYAANLSKAKDAVQNLTGVYEKSAETISATSDMQVKSVQEMMDAQKQHAQKLQDNLSAATDMQMKNTQELFDVQKQHTQKIQKTLDATSEMQVKGVQEIFEMQKLHAQNLQDIHTKNVQKIGQIQEQGSQIIIDNYKKIEEGTVKLADSMNSTVQEAEKYKQEVDKLSKNVAQINMIYANMLAAMTKQ